MDPRRRSIIATVGLVLCILALLLKHWFFARYVVTIAIQIFALLWMIWARYTMGMRSFHYQANPADDAQLVTRGPYQYVRHPIYFAIFLATWAGVIDHIELLSVTLAVFVSIALGVRAYSEETLLRDRFPEYQQYQRTTKQFIPFCY